MATLDWSDCPLVEIIPGKVGGAPLLKNTRLPVEAITGNYDAFRDEGLSPDAALAETLDSARRAEVAADAGVARSQRIYGYARFRWASGWGVARPAFRAQHGRAERGCDETEQIV